MKHFVRTVLCAALFTSFLTAALALPGDSFAGIKARMLARSGFSTRCYRAEMSGEPACNSTTKLDGAQVTYLFAYALGARSYSEAIVFDAPLFDFTHRHDPRVNAIFANVYAQSVASDYLHAKLVARVPVFASRNVASFFLGKRFGYATGSTGVNKIELYSLSDFRKELKNAKSCATRECGD